MYFSELSGRVRCDDVTIILSILSIYFLIFVNIVILINIPVFVNIEIIVNVYSGGFALIAATGIVSNVVGGAGAAAGVGAAGLGTAGIAPILGGLGLVGAAGAGGMALMSMADCGGPFVCVAPSGQCCLVAITFRGVLCPDSC